MTIANPLYDVVFKYLMEDDRIARTILSALLKKDVVAVEMRPHEYSNIERNSLSVFRIDFAATIRDVDGKESLILIEVQKTWLETETLRFRQYLAVHYSNPKNIRPDGNAIPMVAVYILGHKLGGIKEPVLYVSHQSRDYDGKLVTAGMPNAFVDSLTHDSIIVQVPLLQGQINNRLDMVLSIFDQTRKDKNDMRMLLLDDKAYSNDADMDYILRRLQSAAADSAMRHNMNVETEYFSAIEKRDSEIMMRDKELAEKKVLLDEQEARLDEQEARLDEQEARLGEQEARLGEQEARLGEQEAQISLMVKMLLDLGKTPQEIATSLGVDLDVVMRLAAE